MPVERLSFRITEAAESLGVSRAKAYEMVRRGEIPSVQIGGCTRVPVDELRALVAERAQRRTADVA